MSYSSNYFAVNNGLNVRVELAWHPNPPPPPTPSAECQNATIYDDGGYSGKHTYTEVTIRGTNNDQTNYHIGYGDHHTFGYRALSQTITIERNRFYNAGTSTSPNWQSYSDTTQRIDCYHATCNPGQTGMAITVDGNGPNDIVIAGQPFTVNIRLKNDNVSAYRETVPDPDIGGAYRLSVTESPDDYQGGLVEHDTPDSYVNPGSYSDVSIYYPPNGNTSYLRNMTLNFYPDLWPHGSVSEPNVSGNGSGHCSVTFPIYEPFTLEPHATLTYPGTKENPGQITYSTYINNKSASAVPAPTTSSFTFTPYSGGAGCPNNGPINSNGPYPPGGPDYIIGPTNCNPASLTAGDKYCSEMKLNSYNAGYIGPAGDVIGSSVDSSVAMNDRQCLTIINEPYFKTYGTGVSAGGDFSTNGSGDCTGGGLLAGYTDNADSPARGAGSQLSALALIKITGFASAQNSNPSSSPPGAGLTFANTIAADKTSSLDSPSLGGNFDPGGSHCLTDQSATTGTTTVSGPYTYPGKTGINDSESLFVNGDVRITGNITYAGSWTLGSVPSFTLHATGNIYIDPGVTQLDGIYVSNKNIYTCGSGFAPMPASGMYNGCKNQLVFNGLVTAQHIKLQRTFGSLRDEKSIAGSPGGSQIGFVWSSAGSVPGMRCTQINEPSDPDTWNDNYLCVPNTSTLQMAWTHFDNSSYNSPGSAPGGDMGMLNADYWKTHGYPYCIKWDVPPDYSQTWNDNSLCVNQSAGLSFGGNDASKFCTPIVESADPEGSWHTGYFLCEPKAAPPVLGGVPAAPACSNKGSQLITGTCAAEVFNFSPELYLSTPVIQLPNNGAVQYDSVTSLPPVL